VLPSQLKWKANCWSHFHKQGKEPNIFLFSTARSGSTWLMEMIACHKGIKVVNEPFLVTRFSDAPNAILPNWNCLLPNPDREALLESYIRTLIDNKLAVGVPLPHERLYKMFTNRVLFKILRCKDMMNWFEDKFEGKILYLVRHPVATAASRSNYGRLPLFLANEVFCEQYLTPDLREFGVGILNNGTDIEKKALDWCLQNRPPLKFLDRSNWICTTYENLVVDPGEIVRVLHAIGISCSQQLDKRLSEASLSSRRSDKTTKEFLRNSKSWGERAYLIRKWRQKVTTEEERKVFAIVERFGIDLYKAGFDMPVKVL